MGPDLGFRKGLLPSHTSPVTTSCKTMPKLRVRKPGPQSAANAAGISDIVQEEVQRTKDKIVSQREHLKMSQKYETTPPLSIWGHM